MKAVVAHPPTPGSVFATESEMLGKDSVQTAVGSGSLSQNPAYMFYHALPRPSLLQPFNLLNQETV